MRHPGMEETFAVAGGVAKSVVDVIAQMYPDKEIRVANAEGLKECKKLFTACQGREKYNGYLLEVNGMPRAAAWQVPEQMQPVKKSRTAVSLYTTRSGSCDQR